MIVSIKGKKWKVFFLSREEYVKTTKEENSGAMTIFPSRKILFSVQNMYPGTIRHELLHAYCFESNTESSMLGPIQVEEICASIVQHHWLEIEVLTDKILNKFLDKIHKFDEY